MNCALAAGTLAINHPDGIDDVTARVSGANIQVLDDGTPVACGGGPTVNNTTQIVYTNSGGSISDFIIEEPDKFAPGTGGPAEGAGNAEIEISATETGGILSEIRLVDGDGGGDSYTIGAGGVNFNPAEPIDDVDITSGSSFARFIALGGAGDDRFDARGGDGAGGVHAERLELRGEGGNDQLFGGTDSDDIAPGAGDDVADGGGGTDALDYSESTAGVNIDLLATGPQNGGSFGMDTLANFEEVTGSPHNDVLRGTDGQNDIFGLAGDDLVEGRGDDDFMDGGPGVDTASFEGAGAPVTADLGIDTQQDTGGAGKDFLANFDFESLVGGAAGDTLRGTNGINRIDGRGGADTVVALGGDDAVLARDGASDNVDCGDGDDSATLDRVGLDVVTACEASLFAPDLPALAAAPDRAIAFALAGARSQRLVRGGIEITVGCPSEACSIVASASVVVPAGNAGSRAAARVRFKSARASLASGQTRKLRLRLARKQLRSVLRALRRGRKLTVAVSVTATDGAGNRLARKRSIKLKRR